MVDYRLQRTLLTDLKSIKTIQPQKSIKDHALAGCRLWALEVGIVYFKPTPHRLNFSVKQLSLSLIGIIAAT